MDEVSINLDRMLDGFRQGLIEFDPTAKLLETYYRKLAPDSQKQFFDILAQKLLAEKFSHLSPVRTPHELIIWVWSTFGPADALPAWVFSLLRWDDPTAMESWAVKIGNIFNYSVLRNWQRFSRAALDGIKAQCSLITTDQSAELTGTKFPRSVVEIAEKLQRIIDKINFDNFAGVFTEPVQTPLVLELKGLKGRQAVSKKESTAVRTEHAMANEREPKKHVLLSYCHENQEEVQRLRDELVAAGETVWWDQDIQPGQDWKLEIRKAMKNAYAVVLCLSKESQARATSGIYPEAMDAINLYREYAPGCIFLIPVRLSKCEIPPIELDGTRTLDRLQYADLFPSRQYAAGVKKLLGAIRNTPHHPQTGSQELNRTAPASQESSARHEQQENSSVTGGAQFGGEAKGSLKTRFFDLFVNGFLRTVKEKFIDGILVVLILIYTGSTGKLNLDAWKTNFWGTATPWIWLFCGIAAFHVVRTAIVLLQQIKAEQFPIEISGRERSECPPRVPYYQLKVCSGSLLLISLLAVLSYAVYALRVPTKTTIANEPDAAIPKGRIRILNHEAIPAAENPAGFPAITFFYDNSGIDLVTSVVNRFGAGFGNGLLSDQAVLAEQDKLLRWDGWPQEMARRRQNELRPGDPGEFTTVPNMEGILAKQFRENFDEVKKGKKVLYVFITFKFFDQSGRIGVTETCSYFSLTFARHICGRGRTFYE